MQILTSKMQLDKIILDDYPSWIDWHTAEMWSEFNRSKDKILKDALIKADVDVEDLVYISEHFTRIMMDGDKYDHFYIDYGTPEEKRIISIERMPEVKQDGNRYTISSKFY